VACLHELNQLVVQALAAHVAPAGNRLAQRGEAIARTLRHNPKGSRWVVGGDGERGAAARMRSTLASGALRLGSEAARRLPCMHLRVEPEQRAQPQESVLLLDVVADAAQSGAPGAQEGGGVGRQRLGAHPCQAA
jgi:hypothetical protein